ncbi:MAG: hypothetical protein NVSMB22_12280 [Chloroflexota bacterium]
MCRSIKTLRRLDPIASEEEIHDAALQFVRKISGYRKPSRVNQAVFDTAVDEIAAASRHLLEGLADARGSIPDATTVRAPVPAHTHPGNENRGVFMADFASGRGTAE